MEQRLAEVEQRVAALEGKEPRTMSVIQDDVAERLDVLERRVQSVESLANQWGDLINEIMSRLKTLEAASTPVESLANQWGDLINEIMSRLKTLEAASTPVAGRDMGMASQARRGTPERRLERSRG